MAVSIQFNRSTQDAWGVFQKILADFGVPEITSSSMTASTPAGDEIKFTGSVGTSTVLGIPIITSGKLTEATITCGGELFMSLTGLDDGAAAIQTILLTRNLEKWFSDTLGRGTTQQGSDGGDDCTDLVNFLTGADNISGGSGLDTLLGGDGEDTIRGGDDSDVIDGGSGADLILGTLSEYKDDKVQNFDSEDKIQLIGNKIDRSDITLDSSGTAIWQIDENNDGAFDGTMSIQGNFSLGDLITYILDGVSFLRYSEFIPALAEGVAVAASSDTGIRNQDYLTGDGNGGYRVTLLQEDASASYDNALGVYEVDDDGNIVDVRILFNNTNDTSITTADVSDVEAGHELGFFIVQDGADWANALSASDTFSFIDTTDNSTANVSDGANVRMAVNGIEADVIALHSYDRTMNIDGNKHALAGVDPGGRSVTVGFEDLTENSDFDCQDVVFRVEAFDL